MLSSKFKTLKLAFMEQFPNYFFFFRLVFSKVPCERLFDFFHILVNYQSLSLWERVVNDNYLLLPIWVRAKPCVSRIALSQPWYSFGSAFRGLKALPTAQNFLISALFFQKPTFKPAR